MAHRFIALLALFLVMTQAVIAQEPAPSSSSSNISLSGRSRLTGASTSPLPASSSLPDQYLRWEFEPRLSLWGVPISAHLLLTTESDLSRRAMNTFEVGFDADAFEQMLRDRVMAKVRETEGDLRTKLEGMKAKLGDPTIEAELRRFNELRDMDVMGLLADSAKAELEHLSGRTEEARKIAAEVERLSKLDPVAYAKEQEKELRALHRELTDPSKLESRLREMDLISGTEKFLYGFKDLGVGVTYPTYSQLVLTGMPVTGASLEYTYGIFTVAGAGGTMNGPIPDARLALETFDRSLVAGKIGLGATAGPHFHLMGLYATDDSVSATPDSAYSPARNYVLAADARVELFDRAIAISGLLAGSVYTRDLNAPAIEFDSSDDPTGLADRVDPRISTTVDYAWNAEAAFNLFDGATRARVGMKMVGPGYTSLGVPYLRTDLLGQEGDFEQRLFDGQVMVGGYFKKNEDNIVPWKQVRVGEEWLPARTTLTSYGGRAGLQFRGLPYLRVEYAPYLQQTDIEGDTSGTDNRTAMISASAGHGYRLFDLTGSTNVTALVQEGTSNNGLYRFTNRAYIINQSVGFTFPLSVTATGSYTETEIANTLITIASLTGSGSMRITDFLRGTLSLTYSGRNDGGSRLGFSVRAAVKLWGYGELDLRAERSAFQSGVSVDQDYEQLRFRGVLTTTW